MPSVIWIEFSCITIIQNQRTDLLSRRFLKASNVKSKGFIEDALTDIIPQS
jgi:hypothetical protein